MRRPPTIAFASAFSLVHALPLAAAAVAVGAVTLAPAVAEAAPAASAAKGKKASKKAEPKVVETEAAAGATPTTVAKKDDKKPVKKGDQRDEKKDPPEGVTENASDATPGAKPGEKPEEPREESETPWAGRHRSALTFTAQLGASYLDAAQFASTDLALDRPDGVGPALSFGVGYRLGILRFGARFVDHEGPRLTMWGFQGDVSIGLSRARWEPYVGGHAGYTWAHRVDTRVIRDSLPTGTIVPPDVSLGGAYFGGDLGVDYHWQTWLSVGATAALDAMVLRRARAGFPDTLVAAPASARQDTLYATSGASLGLAVTAGLRATAIFDL